MNNISAYMKDLKIVRGNLNKFYYHSASEWLKPEVLRCINFVNNEIYLYENLVKQNKLKEERIKITIYDLVEESEL